MNEVVRTTCPYCGVGCGVLATPGGESKPGLGQAHAPSIAGDPLHPANFGRLCSKGAALGETLDLEGRLLSPACTGEKPTGTRPRHRGQDSAESSISMARTPSPSMSPANC